MSTMPGKRSESAESHSSGSVAAGVFYPAAAIIVAFVIFAMTTPETAYDSLLAVQNQIVGKLGWYYVILVSGFVVFALWVGLGPMPLT